MSFLTNLPDLSDTIYSTQGQYLQEIRNYLVAEVKKVAPEWLDKPEGTLGKYWNSDELYATCNLIWIAIMLSYISDRVDEEYIPRLQEKFKALLYAQEPKFLEYRAELEVAWHFASYVDSFVIEPLAKRGGIANSSNLAKSPDFAFDLEDRVYLEVTIFYVGILEKWQKAVDYITATIRHRLLKKERHLKLHVQLPLHLFDAKQSPKFDANQIIERVWSKMLKSDTGVITVIPDGKIQWEPYPVTIVQDSFPFTPPVTDNGSTIPPTIDGGWDVLIHVKTFQDNPSGFVQITPFGVHHSSNYLVDKASFVEEPDIVALSEKDVRAANEFVLKSLKRKLKVDKREQFSLRRQKPYLLAMKAGHYRIQDNGLIKLIERHIWSDEDYDWITGIVLFTSRQGFKATDPSNQYIFCFNPNAVCSVSEPLKTQFHMKEREIKNA